ncbi:NB-ARC domain-containing protein [Deinococcus petrolearius]|uniref:NB-ARC domain-containing protein n=1 Tax=Deinococcus petrolearius TaxID=1751295 RepID=A0ABW1DLV5_9DEIO
MLRTLGTLELTGSAFGRTKPLTLLAYLALEGPVSRRQLRTLFWGYSPEAGNSLRVTLSQLRAALPGVIQLGGEQVSVDMPCDAVLLMRAVQDQLYADALTLYGGPFLPGWGQHGPELDDWWSATRDHLASRAAQAALCLGDAAAATGDWTQGATFAAQALAILGGIAPTPLLERAYRLLRAADDPASELLLAPYGLSLPVLSPEVAQATFVPHILRLPAAPETAFVGRQDELGWLLRHVPTSRFVTVRGLGGSGKTRLVQAALAEPALRSHFSDLAWISVGETSPQTVMDTIGTSFGLTTSPVTLAALARRLADRRVLLILDGADALAAQPAVVHDLLQWLPQLHVVLTARTALYPHAGHVLPLGGFPLPEGALPADHPARQLLAQGAQDAGRPPLQTTETVEELDAICRLVCALPLALMQAGRLCRTMPPAQVSRALRRDLRALEAGSPQEPQAGSFQNVWNTTFQGLTADERAATLALSAVQGPIDIDLMTALELPFGLLIRLHDLSLLELSSDGAFTWHPLAAAYARHSGSAPQRAEVRAALATVMLRLLNERAGEWATAPMRHWAQAHDPDIQDALDWGIATGAAQMRAVLESVVQLYEVRAQYEGGLELFQQLRSRTTGAHPLWPDLLMGAAWFAFRLGRWHDAQAWAEEALGRVPPDAPALRMQLENTLGSVAMARQDPGGAEVHFRRALTGSVQLGDTARQMSYLGNLATTQFLQGAYPASAESYRQALSLSTAHSDEARRSPLVGGWAYLQLFWLDDGAFRTAFHLLEGQIARLTELGLPVPAYLHLYVSYAALLLNNLARALAAAQLARDVAHANKEVAFELDATLMCGRVQALGGDPAQGLTTLTAGLRQACRLSRAEAVRDALLFSAEAQLQLPGNGSPAWLRQLPRASLLPFQQRLYDRLLAQPPGEGDTTDPPLDVWLALQFLADLR